MKYYTPHKDEFHDGVIFEEFDGNSWIEKTHRTDINNNVRIPYLTGDDVLDLGFELLSEEMVDIYQNDSLLSTGRKKGFYKEIYISGKPYIIELHLVYIGDEPMITIMNEDATILSEMFCKNKNELKWILSRLQII